MTQPPLSRAVKELELDLGVGVFIRTTAGVEMTPAGEALYDEARSLLEQSESLRTRVVAAAGAPTLMVGTLANSASEAGTRLADQFRQLRPDVHVHVREVDLTDPSAGLRAGIVDVALTRGPFERAGLNQRILREDPVAVIVRADDDLATRANVTLADLQTRRWFRFPDDVDPFWRQFWTGAAPPSSIEGPVVRTAQECLQAVLWSDTIGLAPLDQPVPQGLAMVPVVDMPASPLVVAWRTSDRSDLVRTFVETALNAYRRPRARARNS